MSRSKQQRHPHKGRAACGVCSGSKTPKGHGPRRETLSVDAQLEPENDWEWRIEAHAYSHIFEGT